MISSASDDAILDLALRYGRSQGVLPSTPTTALLTGATGFLGAHILADLLAHTSCEVICLVREASGGNARLKHALAAQGVWRDTFEARIRLLQGDLTKRRLGLSDASFAALGGEVDIIYHNAAQTNFVFPYRALKAANVSGTHEMLRLASMSPPKSFHFVSSTKVFGSLKYATFLSPANQVCKEDFQVPAPIPSGSGYGMSKWVAERLVNAAAERGLTASIYRPGMITGHSRTGVCNADDIFSLMVKGCLLLGTAPMLDAQIHLTPVDFVSRAIVELSRIPTSAGRAFHMLNPVPISWLQVVDALRSAGAVKQTLAYEGWRRDVVRRGREQGDEALQPLCAVLSDSRPPFASARRILAQENTAAGLAIIAAPRYPESNVSLLARYIRYLDRRGAGDPKRQSR